MEKNENEETVEEGTTTQTEDNGGKSEADIKVEQLNADTERINKAIAENENAKAREKLGGMSEAGQTLIKKPEISDKEYAEKAINGEFNEKK